jgi:hypothetical protein
MRGVLVVVPGETVESGKGKGHAGDSRSVDPTLS